MAELSLCMIVRNEADVLARCLASVGTLADEIVIVDTGSTDGTLEIARQFTNCVYEIPWADDFAAARNVSFQKATKPFLMWLDADDVIEREDFKRLQQLKRELTPAVDAVYLLYHTNFDAAGNPTFSYYRERIVKNDAKFRWVGEVHETITVGQNCWYRDAAISHKKQKPSDGERNLRILRKIKASRAWNAREHFYYGTELFYHGDYAEAAEELRRYLHRADGWTENRIEACKFLYYALRKLHCDQSAVQALYESFCYDLPRAEICCELGYYYESRKEWAFAAYWFTAALGKTPNYRSGAFVLKDCYDYVPYLELSVCSYWLGDVAKAKEYNRLAEVCKPHSAACRHNREFYARL